MGEEPERIGSGVSETSLTIGWGTVCTCNDNGTVNYSEEIDDGALLTWYVNFKLHAGFVDSILKKMCINDDLT